MQRQPLKALPICSEERRCARPSTEQILRLFARVQRHTLLRQKRIRQTFEVTLRPPQQQVLDFLGVPSTAFCG